MASISRTGRDLHAFKAGFQAWLHHRFAARGPVEIGDVALNAENGLSNEMFFVKAAWRDTADTESLVVRLPPTSECRLFPEYDLQKQSLIQRILAQNGLPAVVPLAYEPDPRWIGSYFMVMPRVEGRSPPDQPSYAEAGWVKDLPPARRTLVFEGFLQHLAQMHRLDVDATGLRAIAARSDKRGSALRDEWQWWMAYLDWFSAGNDAADFRQDIAEVGDLFGWCAAHWPAAEPRDSLLWGDARPGNVLYGADQSVAALLDFETITIGPAETDIGWWMASRLNKFKTIPELPGLFGREDSYSFYERQLGRELMNIEWYEIFGAARIAASVCGIRAMLRRRSLPDFKMKPIAPWARAAIDAYPSA